MAVEVVRFGASGAKVTALHRGLVYLIRNQGSVTDGMRAAFLMQLEHDRIPNRFGSATAGIVGIYQAQLVSRVKAKTKNNPDPIPDKFVGLPMMSRGDAATGTGQVNDLTAEALNWLISETRGIRKLAPPSGKQARLKLSIWEQTSRA